MGPTWHNGRPMTTKEYKVVKKVWLGNARTLYNFKDVALLKRCWFDLASGRFCWSTHRHFAVWARSRSGIRFRLIFSGVNVVHDDETKCLTYVSVDCLCGSLVFCGYLTSNCWHQINITQHLKSWTHVSNFDSAWCCDACQCVHCHHMIYMLFSSGYISVNGHVFWCVTFIMRGVILMKQQCH